MLKHIPVRVDGKLELVVLYRTPDWLSVKIDKDRRCPAEEDRRWISFQPLNILWSDHALAQIGEQTIKIQ
jgi:hypothetical protein